MADNKIMTKRVQINRSEAMVVGSVAVAVFIAIFTIISGQALFKQSTYQVKVISQKEEARDTINQNVETVSELVQSYKEFTSSPTNMLDGNPAGNGEKDGDNARLVLDALPSKYDFPALTASLEKILNDKGFKDGSISGTDDEIAQSGLEGSDDPQAVEIPFSISVSGPLTNIQDLINTFEKSIRPFNIQKMTLSGGANDLSASFEVKTYFQPEKIMQVKQEEVKR